MPLLFLSQDDAFTDSTISSESCPYNGHELTGQRCPMRLSLSITHCSVCSEVLYEGLKH
jgi:hypothetical protein